jgi:hypothetical protein
MNELLNNWGFVSVVAVFSVVVSAVTIQLYALLRQKETVHQRKTETLEFKSRELRAKMIAQQVQLLRDELERFDNDPALSERLDTAKRITTLIEDSLKAFDTV